MDTTIAQYRALVVLASRGPQRMSDLAAALDVTPSTAGRMCDRLLRKGLIRRHRARADRRAVQVSVTASGREVVDQATALGLLLLAIPQMYGVGYPVMYKAVGGSYALWFLIVLAAGKIIACSLTIGIGGSGGVFAPSLFIGATSGMAFGEIANHLLGPAAGQPALCAVVGMGAVFASAARAPLTSVASVVEMCATTSAVAASAPSSSPQPKLRSGAATATGSHSFQAPGFYGRFGYQECGRTPGYPHGHDDIHLVKQLR